MKKAFLILSLSALCANAAAQSVPFMLRNADARSMAVAKVGLENDAAYNALSGKPFDFIISYGMIDPGNVQNTISGFSSFVNFHSVSVGLSLRYNMDKPYPIVGNNTLTTGTFTPYETAIGASFAYRISDSLSVSFRANDIYSVLTDETRGVAGGFDFSATYIWNGIKAVLSLRNIGSGIQYGEYKYSLPAFVCLGASYSKEGLTAYLETGCLFCGSLMAGVGVEYKVIDILSCRAGFHAGSAKYVPSYASIGLGLNLGGPGINLSYIPPIFGNAGGFMLSAGYSL